ncbi:MAG TPA: tetratricopeptide repeat protein [Minicystis sp.]|nr:tetratricopeptide repeat protein [Minicystis sp.]
MSTRRAVVGAVVVVGALGALVAWRATRKVDHLDAGYAALLDKDAPAAIAHLRIAVAERPNDGIAHYDLGIAYENAGWTDQALPEFERAVELEPTNDTFRSGLAQTRRTLGYRAQVEQRYRDAVNLYQRVVALTPDDATTWYNLSVSYKKLGHDDQAKKALARAAELDPSHYKVDGS